MSLTTALDPACTQALSDADSYLAAVRQAVVPAADKGRAGQFACHGLAWIATTVEALRQVHNWAQRLEQAESLGELEQRLTHAVFAEYLAQLSGGLPMSQGEILRPQDVNAADAGCQLAASAAVSNVVALGASDENRARLAELIGQGQEANDGLDGTLGLIREQFQRFAREKVLPHAHEWHLKDELIPDDVVNEMASLGVFGLTVPESFSGLGMGKTAMCVVSEELSRGYIGVGSLGTRSEIAAELILANGTEEQKTSLLPKIASGEILPTAVFTEPNTGSDLASLKTRAVKEGNVYKITGNKTWITHAARTDLMTLLARSNAAEPGHKGLSMFLAEKPRGTTEDPFPAAGMTGGEIGVLGYRGMKEYELGFDGFEVPATALLGGEEGQGFKQLMQTFESARIQTAARAIGVAQNAMDLALAYAHDRQQFGHGLGAGLCP